MAKRIPENALKAIEDAVRIRPNGADLGDIAAVLKPVVPKRTLQYRLKHLVDAGRLAKEGDDRWAKYRIPAAEREVLPAEKVAAAPGKTEEAAVSLSTASKDMRAYLSQPVNARKPVGYNRDFLDSYHPNETFYLSEEQRARLSTFRAFNLSPTHALDFCRPLHRIITSCRNISPASLTASARASVAMIQNSIRNIGTRLGTVSPKRRASLACVSMISGTRS